MWRGRGEACGSIALLPPSCRCWGRLAWPAWHCGSDDIQRGLTAGRHPFLPLVTAITHLHPLHASPGQTDKPAAAPTRCCGADWPSVSRGVCVCVPVVAGTSVWWWLWSWQVVCVWTGCGAVVLHHLCSHLHLQTTLRACTLTIEVQRVNCVGFCFAVFKTWFEI